MTEHGTPPHGDTPPRPGIDEPAKAWRIHQAARLRPRRDFSFTQAKLHVSQETLRAVSEDKHTYEIDEEMAQIDEDRLLDTQESQTPA